MLKISELKEGDLVMAEYDGQWKEGEVTNVDRLDDKAEITTGQDQEFWYDAKHIKPILLDESYVFKLGFQKEPNDDGSVRYIKGAFRVLLHQPGNFSNFEMWYREDRRHISHPIYVHEFQNNFLAMTKVPLAKA
ncbi:MAG: hypothetical protein JWQ09_392 [Segetibacter sp.]|nr:hypothetical protein [Segetibacter sp.]